MTCDIWNELLNQKGAVLSGIATSSHDNAKLRELTEWLQRELDLEAKHKGILSEAERLIAERQKRSDISAKTPQPSSNSVSDSEWTFADLPKGERARIARQAYFERQQERGKFYKKVGRIYYRNGDGVVLGITFSSDNGGNWFLNLKANDFQEAVLMCQSVPRSVRAIHLLTEFFNKHEKQLSEDRKGEVKFNFVRDGNRWLLEVPQPIGMLDVTKYADPEELICKRLEFE